MDPFPAVFEPLGMQHSIHLRSHRHFPSPALRPGGAKRLRVLAPAIEARAMTGGQRDRLVEEEKLGPAATAHHLAPLPFVVEQANEPCLGCPAPAEQRLRRRVMDDAAIADEKATLLDRDDSTERCSTA